MHDFMTLACVQVRCWVIKRNIKRLELERNFMLFDHEGLKLEG